MDHSNHSGTRPLLRVLLAGGTGGAKSPFLDWLWDQGSLVVAGPAATLAETVVLAGRFQPDVVLLDLYGLPVSIGDGIALFKALAPAPKVFGLTHEISDAWRQRCGVLRADAVFHKTAEFDQLAAALAALCVAFERQAEGEVILSLGVAVHTTLSAHY